MLWKCHEIKRKFYKVLFFMDFSWFVSWYGKSSNLWVPPHGYFINFHNIFMRKILHIVVWVTLIQIPTIQYIASQVVHDCPSWYQLPGPTTAAIPKNVSQSHTEAATKSRLPIHKFAVKHSGTTLYWRLKTKFCHAYTCIYYFFCKSHQWNFTNVELYRCFHEN